MIEDTPDILIIDDNKYDVQFLLEALNGHNKVKAVEDGSEALDYLFASGEYSGRDLSKQPRVIVLDLKMPKVNGLEILRKVKSNEMTKMIHVVVFTSSYEDVDRIESYRLGANSYIVKPIDYDSFIKGITEIVFYWISQNVPSGKIESSEQALTIMQRY